MDIKKIRKSIGRFFGWVGLNLCAFIIKVLPQSFLFGFARNLGYLAYHLVRRHRKTALESLKIAFAREKSAQEIVKIARECFVFMAKSVVEFLFLMERPKFIRERVEIVGKDNLDRALTKGKGVILISAHFGNFPLMLVRLGLEGYKVAGIMRPMRDSRIENFFITRRNRFNIKTIYSFPRNTCVNNTIHALRSNEIVFIPIDQNFGTGGVFVDFFGKKAATATGPIVLARRTKAVLLPCFMVRQKDDTHKIIIEQALDLGADESDKESILHSIQKLTAIIESYIRRYPAGWSWIHRRWKSEPSQKNL